MAYTYEELEAYTLIELREMARDLGITGVSKARKDDVIEAILDQEGTEEEPEGEGGELDPAKGVSGSFVTTLLDPDAGAGYKTSTTVRVSCGASSDLFGMAGKSVAEVAFVLKDAFNISDLTTGLVNGKPVKGDYVLEAGDNLEFLKPAGDKG